MQFPFRDLTNQYISLSYHDVVQRYAQGTASYFLDGLGNVIAFVPTSSLGQQLVTADQLVFINGSSSWASASLSSSYAQYADTASLTIYTQQVTSASYASHSHTSDTASMALVGRIAYYAYVAEVAETASIALLTTTASHAEIADFSYHSVTSDYALSASTANHANIADFALGSQVITGSMTNEEFDLLFCSQSGGSVPVYQDADHSIRYNPALGRLTADHIVTNTITASYIYGSISNAINADTASLATYSEFAGSSSYALESTFSDTASLAYYADYAGSSSYALSASRAEIALSASWAPGGQTGIAEVARSASWVSASAFITTAQTASFVTASNIVGVVSSASFATSASWAPGGQAAASVSASWASSSLSCSISASAANVAYSLVLTTTTSASLGQGIFLVDGSDALTYNPSTELISGAGLVGTASWANSASFITASNVQGAITTAVTAYTANAINFVPSAAVSASWVSASAKITTADTASYITASNVVGAVDTAVTAYNANTASYALTTPTSIFSRGGTLFNASYIPNTLTWVTAWRAPFNCTASAFNAIASTNAGFVASASVNARRNGNNMLTASGYPITASSVYVSLGPSFFTNQNFSTGDELEVGFIGVTGSVQQINIQVDFTR